jgi:hypothetical protein
MGAGFDWIKSHKAISAVIAGVVFLVTYLLTKSSGGSSSSSSSDGLTAADASFLQTQAGLQAAAASTNANVQIAQINATTAAQGIAASQDVANQQTAAQQAETLAGYQAAENISGQQYSTEQALGLSSIAANQQIYSQAISAGVTEEQNQQQLASSVLNSRTASQIGGSQNKLALLQSILGATGNQGENAAAIATQQSEGQIQSQPPWYSSLFGAIGNIGGGLLNGFFGGQPSAASTLAKAQQPTNLQTTQPSLAGLYIQ